jgi:hypothetical protein
MTIAIITVAEQRARITRQIELVAHLAQKGNLAEANHARLVLSDMYDALERIVSRAGTLPEVERRQVLPTG